MDTIQGDRVLLRPVTPEDTPELRRILAEPEVARWWHHQEEFGDMLAIVHEGDVAGAIQYFEEEDDDYRHASIDVFLDPARRGKALGVDAVRALARWLITERGHHRLTIDPAAANTAAIRAYEKVGFRPVGVMRAYERDVDGRGWHDNLLMDLLAHELT
ncbi:GNAT family N-acetyltransferase [Bailinhaonella thermotolerans]|uniref:N-acetyltransferase n=1 Tax=Bailinhaonella thermotolerans TaxID=1070861 RepID=A0A3A4A764_9ACTN|nr:GNAT family protein [Bailinhaonella thermotolerans]RJL21753.1 N-acetyltransferase [Bailinhaonella thermotolerans]